MTRIQAAKAFDKEQLVAKSRPGYPHQPFIGQLILRSKNDRYWFKGKSGTEVFVGIVNFNEIFLVNS